MCGIVGVSLNTNKKTLRHGMALFKSLLVENTKRGRDSTGIVYQYKDGTEVFRGFLPGAEAQNYVLPEKDAIGFLGHTRFATVGNKTSYDNVHPFETEKYIGVHNGTIFNHKLLKSHFKLETTGECDSEVVYRLLDKFGLPGLRYIEGLYMLVFIHKDKPEELNMVTNGSKPMVLMKLFGELIAFGSIGEDTKERATQYWEQFKKKYDFEDVKPCTLYRLKDGKIIERRDLSSSIKYMSEKEGELRYKVDYKILKRDLYQMTVPLNRRLVAATQTMVTSNVNTRGTAVKVKDNRSQGKLFKDALLPCNASLNVIPWAMEVIVNNFKMLESRMYAGHPGTDCVAFNIDSLGTPIVFSSTRAMNRYIKKDMPIGKKSTGILPNKSMVMISKFPKDECKNRIWLANSVQTSLLLNAIIYSKKIVLYTAEDDWSTKLPTASQLLSACLCNCTTNRTMRKVYNLVQGHLVSSGILDDTILRVGNEETKVLFETLAKKRTTRVFSKKNGILSPFIAPSYREQKWYGDAAAKRDEKSMFGDRGYKAEDIMATGRAFFVSQVLARLCELVATSNSPRDRIYKATTESYYNKLNEVALDLLKSFREGSITELAKKRDSWKNLTKQFDFQGITSEIDLFEAALKEQLKFAYGNGYFTAAPDYTDIISVLNKNNDSTLLVQTIDLMLGRATVLREFVVNQTAPNFDDIRYKTINLR